MVPHARIIEPELSGTLEKENRHRIERVLRLREGDKFVITDGNGHEATAGPKKTANTKAINGNLPIASRCLKLLFSRQFQKATD